MTAATVEEDITVCLEEWRHQKKTMISARCFFFPLEGGTEQASGSTPWSYISAWPRRKRLVLIHNCANTLECARTCKRSSKQSTPTKPWVDRSNRYRRPVWPVQAGTRWKPRTTSSGGTPSELADLGMLWDRQAAQNTFKRCQDAGRI